MKRFFKHWTLAILFAASVGGAATAVMVPQTASAACNDRLLTFPAWFRGLTDGNCDIKVPEGSKGGLSTFVWKIVLNIVEIILQAVGYLSVIYIIWGGYKFMYAAGAPDAVVKARKQIMNAVIGLVLSIFSVAIVNVIAGALN